MRFRKWVLGLIIVGLSTVGGGWLSEPQEAYAIDKIAILGPAQTTPDILWGMNGQVLGNADEGTLTKGETLETALEKCQQGPEMVAVYTRMFSLLANRSLTNEGIEDIIDESFSQPMLAHIDGAYGGYTVTDANVEQTLKKTTQVDADNPNLFYVYVQGTPNTGTQTVTLKKIDGTTETRQLTGVKGTDALFGMASQDFDDTKDILLDDQGNVVKTQPYDLLSGIASLEGVTFPTVPAIEQPINGGQSTYTVVAKTDMRKVTIHYQSTDGQHLAPDKVVLGAKGQSQVVESPTITGYTPNQKSVKVAFPADVGDTTLTVTYQKTQTPVTPVSPTTPDEQTSTQSDESSQSSSGDTETAQPFKSFRVYAKRALYRYATATFSQNYRVAFSQKRPRTTADTFKVVGTARSSQGRLRYRLADGTYITANPTYVANLYWQGAQYQRLVVDNSRGIYRYSQSTLSRNKRLKRLKQGSRVRVVRRVRQGTMTRYQLADGSYVTGNKQWVTLKK